MAIKEIKINGKSIQADERELEVEVETDGKKEKLQCLQYVNEHGFEILLITKSDAKEKVVPSRAPKDKIEV